MFETKKYYPEFLSRQGEFSAWGMVTAAGAGLYFLSRQGALPGWTWFLFAILLFSALSMSLGNWMDRKTTLEIYQEGVSFTNGLRSVNLSWENIRSLRTAPARWGVAVTVIGSAQYFSFTTLGVMNYLGKETGRTGFPEGKEIMDEIIRKSELTEITKNGKLVYYSRPEK